MAPTISSATRPSPAATTSAPTAVCTHPPAGPHSRPRHENENGTIPEHEYRPRGVRRVVRPPVQLATVARTEDGMLHPCWAAAVRLPRHGWRAPPPQSWRMVSTPISRRKKRDATRREGRPRLASPSSPARMMKILEAEGGVEAATRLASPHHRTGGHRLGRPLVRGCSWAA
jgi:hypothetical protein